MDLYRDVALATAFPLSFAVIQGGHLQEVHHGGVALPWASVTKLITALTVLQAAMDGVVDLQDAAGPPGATLGHLLAHASGLAFDEDRIIAPPGKRRAYSNRGIEVAAARLCEASGRSFEMEARERVLGPLRMSSTELSRSPAHSASGPVEDLAALAAELTMPRVLPRSTVEALSSVAFPGLAGILPGYGRQKPCDWGYGAEVRGSKSPHWTAPGNSPSTFGHFGQSGSFLWVDPAHEVGLTFLSGTAFGPWAIDLWPRLSAAVLAAYGGK